MKTKLLLAVLLLASSVAVPIHAQQSATTNITAVQPGLMEIAGPRVEEAVAAGITKITATTAKIEVHSPWGNINFRWPKDVKPMAFSVEANGQKKGVATINAPGFTEENRADYKAAFDAVVPIAISQAQAQKKRKR